MATRTTRLSVASVSRSTNSDRSNPLTRAVIEGWVTPSTVARAVIRRGPDRSNVASVDKAVRLISRGVRAIADAESPRRISPIAIGPRVLDGPFVAARFGLIPISIGYLYCLSILFVYIVCYLFRSSMESFAEQRGPGERAGGPARLRAEFGSLGRAVRSLESIWREVGPGEPALMPVVIRHHEGDNDLQAPGT